MKKYLITGLAAVAISGMFTSCTHETDAGAGGTNLGVVETYEQAFISRFGTPSADADWGFGNGATKAGTRALPTLPSNTFRDTNPISQPGLPEGKTYYNTLEDAIKNGGAIYSQDRVNKYQDDDVIYIDEKYNFVPDSKDLTIYVDGEVSFSANTHQNRNGVTFCVTTGSTLKLGSMSQLVSIYLAPGATLDVSRCFDWQGNDIYYDDYSDWQNPKLHVKQTTISFNNNNKESSPGFLYLSAGSQVLGTDLLFTNGYKVMNAGGTISSDIVKVDKNSTIWNEGEIDVTTLQLQDVSSSLYNANGKIITTESISIINNYDLLYNDGIINCDGAITLNNTSAEIINNGNLTGASMYFDAGGKFHNEGTTVITGLTKVTNTNSWWANDGKYTSGSFEITGGSAKNVFNNCSLTVKATDTDDDGVADTDGVFFINEGGFILNGGASLVTDYVTWTNKSNVWMGSKALMLVKETFLTNNYDTECGIHGEGNEYAVVKAKSITHNGNDQSRMNYYGKLYIDADYHFPQWYKDASSNKQPAYYHEDKVKFSFTDEKDPNVKKEDSPVVIEKDDEKGCTPGYNTTGGGDEPGGGDETGGGDDETTPSIRVIAEDMGDQSLKEASDFDFNDVVFDVTWVSDSEVDVEILAAGGTLPLTIGWNGNETNESGYIDYEVHNLLGYSETMIINTHSSVGNHIDGVPSKHLTLNGTFRKNHFAEDVRDNIPVKVRKNNRWYEIKADQGKVAGKLAVDKEYDPWCNERKDIDDWWQNADKKGLFSKYTQDPTTLTKYWYKQAKFRQLKPGEYIELK